MTDSNSSQSERPADAREDDPAAFLAKLRAGRAILFRPRRAADPAVDARTVLMIDPLRRPPRPGELILWRRARGEMTLQRVVKVRANQVWLWGQTLRWGDGPYPLAQVLGIARLRGLGRLEHARQLCWRFFWRVANVLGVRLFRL